MGSILRSLVGRKVSIYSSAGQGSLKDEGVVRNVDEQCIAVEKGAETLIFPLYSVRLIKVIE